jgi:tetratricopeptide (TPR) repeat protein
MMVRAIRSIAVVLLFVAASTLLAQRPGGGGPPPGGGFRPGPQPNVPNPGGFRPQAPQPGVPQPGVPHPGVPQPGVPQPGVPQPGMPNVGGGVPQPGLRPAPPSPWQVHNPLASRSRIVPAGAPVPIPVVHVPVPGAPPSPDVDKAQDILRSGDPAAVQAFIQGQVKQSPDPLANLYSTVSSLQCIQAPSPGLDQMRNSALELARNQIQQGANKPLPWVVVAQLSLHDRNQQQFRDAAQALREKFPDSEFSHFFTGVQHLQDRDFAAAERSLKRARELGMPEESIAEMLRMAIDNQKWVWQWAQITLVLFAVWASGLVALFAIGKYFSRRTLAGLAEIGEASPRDRRLRNAYRTLINVAGVYYYLSLPMVVLLALAVPLSLAYAMLLVPYLNLLLVVVVFVLGLGGLITAISGIRAAFVRVRPFEEGRLVTPAEVPELWQLVHDVAERVGTRPVDEIRLMLGTEVAVVERGSYLQRMRDSGKRVLILGLGALEGLKVDSLKAIVAHEYGHFQNRDTAGGDAALRVYLAMRNFADAIVKRGKISRWDIAIHFLRFYHRLFRRLTFGASRLQEVQADRIAVSCYGASAFREGLTHVIRRVVEFDWGVSKAIRDQVTAPQPELAFFRAALAPELSEREQIETAVAAILKRPTDADDSHPSPGDRFRFAERLDPTPKSISEQIVWDLFAGHEPILAEMNDRIVSAINTEAKDITKAQKQGVRQLSNLLDRYPSPELYCERARLYRLAGDHAKAVADYDETLKRVPDLIEIRFQRAMSYDRLANYAAAVEDLRAIVRSSQFESLTGEDQTRTHLLLAECLCRSGRCAEAILAFDQALAKQPDSLRGLVGRGRAHAHLNDHAAARRDFDAALSRWPDSPEAASERTKLAEVSAV